MSEIEQKVESTIRHAYRRIGGKHEAVTYHSPLDDLLAKDALPDVGAMTEEQLLEEAAKQNVSVPESADRLEIIELLKDARDANWEQRVKGMRGMMQYCFADGPHPLKVLERVYAVAKAVYPDLILNMSQEALAVLCNDGGRATVSARIKRLYNEPVARAGMNGSHLPWQKSASAVQTYADRQRGNQNRKGKKFNERFNGNGARKAA
jgi:hypothetical protein